MAYLQTALDTHKHTLKEGQQKLPSLFRVAPKARLRAGIRLEVYKGPFVPSTTAVQMQM